MSNYNETQYDVPIYKSLNELVSINNYFDNNIILREIPQKIIRNSSMYDISNIDNIYMTESFSDNSLYMYFIYVVYFILFLIFFILFFTLV
jgi:hypothetical protein